MNRTAPSLNGRATSRPLPRLDGHVFNDHPKPPRKPRNHPVHERGYIALLDFLDCYQRLKDELDGEECRCVVLRRECEQCGAKPCRCESGCRHELLMELEGMAYTVGGFATALESKLFVSAAVSEREKASAWRNRFQE